MYVVGYATEQEVKELQAMDWDVEDARRYGQLMSEDDDSMITPPDASSPSGTRCVVVFVDAGVFDCLRSDWYAKPSTVKERDAALARLQENIEELQKLTF